MFLRVAAFELRYQLRQPLFWAVAAMFAVLSFTATITDALAIGGAIGSLNRNAPFVVVRMLGNLSLVGAFMIVAFVATSALRDFEHRTDELVFSRPVRHPDLLFGRFAGSVLACGICFLFAAAGLFAGSLMPWLEPERVGPIDVTPYVYGLAVLACPNFIILGGVSFALASRVRNIAAVYVALVALLVGYFAASAMFSDLESRGTAALLDPFGLSAFDLQTRYWTIVEKNSRLPALIGEVFWNRLSWLALGLTVLVATVRRFRYDRLTRRPPSAATVASSPIVSIQRVRERATFTRATAWGQFLSQLRLEIRAVLWSLPFVLILAFGVINVLANIGYLDVMMGTPVWPVTHLMLLAIRAGYSFLLIVIVTFFAGEVVWRERNQRLDDLLDALPVPTWTPVLAKLAALWAAVVVFIAAGMLALAGFQLSKGYTHLEPLLYVQGFFVEAVPYLLIAALALFFQVVARRKLVGYLLMVLYLVSNVALGTVHFEHYLYRYAGSPSAPYSDMNGWGHFASPLFWFNLYWALGAAILVCLAYGGWVRGYEPRGRSRWSVARERLRGPALAAMLAVLAGFAATGGYIFYNTNVLNEYVPSDDAERRQAEYEKKYRQYRDLPQPRVTSIHANVDIYPRNRRADIRGTYRLSNRYGQPISMLHLGIPRRLRIVELNLPPHRVVLEDRRLGYSIYELTTPLAAGQEMALGFRVEIANQGFVNSDPDNSVVENGTFFTTRQFPSLGYQDSRQLADPAQRRRQGLPPYERMAKIDDRRAREKNDLAGDADWLDFEAILSTDGDQIAIAPGSLQREWSVGGRRYFHYKTDAQIPKFLAFLSARYAVRRDSWNAIDISIFHHPGHEYNVARMMDAVKATLRYMTDNFSPYQDRQVRIVEFPRYLRSAASFPTIIPFSESIGFIARLKDETSIDYPFYVTAHEVAHQWWGYQVLGANVQGAAMLSESMAQYSALMVMKQKYGPEMIRRFLRHELDRYLSGRGGALVEEVPLELVENQPYIHYNKGSLVLYSLQDSLGEARLNDALRRYIASVRFQRPPYTVSRDLLAFVAEVTPPERQPLLADLFGSITLFANEATSAVSRARADGRYEVTLTAKTRKLHSDGKGVETEIALDDWIDVGIFGETTPTAGRRTETLLYLQKHRVTGSEFALTTTVDGRPLRAGIDPYHVLIDRTPGDNVRAVAQR